jgi:hypothetical protein
LDSIFLAKEEFIFVFGGRDERGCVTTVEVFDVHREIWRQFGTNASKRGMMRAA